jgi:hypothetical protein
VKVPLYGCDCYAYGLLAAGHVDLIIERGLKVPFLNYTWFGHRQALLMLTGVAFSFIKVRRKIKR